MAVSELVKVWGFHRKAEPTKEILEVLLDNENILQCYQTVRDIAALTDLRIIVMDKQGITGKKIEIFSIPYRSIDMWSSENSGIIDFNSELELWTKAGHFKINLKKECDIRTFDKILGEAILRNQ